MGKVYKATFRSHLYLLTQPLGLLLLLYILFCAITKSFIFTDTNLTAALLFVWILAILPALILHIIYSFNDAISTLDYNPEKDILTYSDAEGAKTYRISDIKNIEIVGYFPHWRGLHRPMPWEKYMYFKFTFGKGESLIITSLLIKKLPASLKKKCTYRHTSFPILLG